MPWSGLLGPAPGDFPEFYSFSSVVPDCILIYKFWRDGLQANLTRLVDKMDNVLSNYNFVFPFGESVSLISLFCSPGIYKSPSHQWFYTALKIFFFNVPYFIPHFLCYLSSFSNFFLNMFTAGRTARATQSIHWDDFMLFFHFIPENEFKKRILYLSVHVKEFLFRLWSCSSQPWSDLVRAVSGKDAKLRNLLGKSMFLSRGDVVFSKLGTEKVLIGALGAAGCFLKCENAGKNCQIPPEAILSQKLRSIRGPGFRNF